MYMPMRAVLSIIPVDTWCFTPCMVRSSKIPLKFPTPTPASPPQIPLNLWRFLSLPKNFVSGAHSAKRRTPSDDLRLSDGLNSIGECRLR